MCNFNVDNKLALSRLPDSFRHLPPLLGGVQQQVVCQPRCLQLSQFLRYSFLEVNHDFYPI